jgi:solute carrier family 25 2-oxodicarboxylate transporter 21
MEAPKRATKFAANDEWGKVYRNLFGVTKMNQSLSILTGASAGATEAFVVVPFELVKIRLQGKHRKLKSRRRSVTNIPNRQGASLPVFRPS